MSKLVEITDGFARDENGKIHIRPMKLIGQLMSAPPVSDKNSGEKQRRSVVRRNLPPIAPLRFDPSEFEEPQQLNKRPKLEEPGKKEFKVPRAKIEKRFPSSNIQQSKKKINDKFSSPDKRQFSIPVKKKNAHNDGSPLFDVEEAEQLLSHQRSFIKPIKTVLFPPLASIKEESKDLVVDNSSVSTEEAKNSTEMSSPMNSSCLEFLELEKTVASVKKNTQRENAPSPMSSVCSLFEKAKIDTSNNKDILGLVKESREEVQCMRKVLEVSLSCLERQESKLDQIIEFLEQEKENEGDLNSSRRSRRLANRSNAVSPLVTKKEDLRKKTLNKNFSKNLQCESPRTKRAVDMYNFIRNDCSILCTPKLDRTDVDMPQSSATRSLSRRIQKQCLLLQDTPKAQTS